MAFVLTQEAMLAAAPVLLPLLALYASRQRERLTSEAEQAAQLARFEEMLLDLQADAADEVAAEVGAELRELLKQAAAAAQKQGGGSAEATRLLKALEGKLSAVEGSVLSAGWLVGVSVLVWSGMPVCACRQWLWRLAGAVLCMEPRCACWHHCRRCLSPLPSKQAPRRARHWRSQQSGRASWQTVS